MEVSAAWCVSKWDRHGLVNRNGIDCSQIGGIWSVCMLHNEQWPWGAASSDVIRELDASGNTKRCRNVTITSVIVSSSGGTWNVNRASFSQSSIFPCLWSIARRVNERRPLPAAYQMAFVCTFVLCHSIMSRRFLTCRWWFAFSHSAQLQTSCFHPIYTVVFLFPFFSFFFFSFVLSFFPSFLLSFFPSFLLSFSLRTDA